MGAATANSTARPLISIISPVYGCKDCLEALAAAVRSAFEGKELQWELILVDDRAPDNPWTLIQAMVAEDARIRGIKLSRNHGQHLAIWAGLEAAKGDWISVIDCDLQDDPALIPDLYERIEGGNAQAVVVKRGKWSDNWFRRQASRSFYAVLRLLSGFELENVGNFGLYSRRMVDTLLLFREQELFLPLMIKATGLKTEFVELGRSARHTGTSAYSLIRLLRLAAAIIIRFSDRPLKLSVFVGMFFSSVSAVISCVLLLMWLTGEIEVPGWTSTMLSMWFLSGVIIAVLGLHGMYIGRIFTEVKQRPRLVVEATAAHRAEDRP